MATYHSMNPGNQLPTNEFVQEVLKLTNEFRAENGKAPLKLNGELTNASQDYAEAMDNNNYFSHTGQDGSQPWDRGEKAGYDSRGYGENIARGYETPSEVVEGWINSSGHRANMLRDKWVDIGIGVYDDPKDSFGPVWVQNFGTGDLA